MKKKDEMGGLPKKEVSILSPTISLRPKPETYAKIARLSNIHETKTEVIEHALDMSYNGLIMAHTLKSIFPSVKKVFGEKAFLSEVNLGGMKEDIDTDNLKVDFSFSEGHMVFDIPSLEKKCKESKISSEIHLLELDMKIETLDSMKIKIIKPLLRGPYSEIPKDILIKINELGSQHGLQLKSENARKRFERILKYYLEARIYPMEDNWQNAVTKALRKFKLVIDELCKNPFFVEDKS